MVIILLTDVYVWTCIHEQVPLYCDLLVQVILMLAKTVKW